MFCLFGPLEAFAQSAIQLNSSYRYDSLKWSIAGDTNGENPNVLSELTWDDLESFQIGFQGSVILPQKNHQTTALYFTIKGDYGFIHSGKNWDSDYGDDNRTGEFSRSVSSSDHGNTLDLSVGFGPQFALFNKKLSLTPMVGYSYHEQNLTMRDGVLAIPDNGPFEGLDSSYETRWKGPWAGLSLRYQISPVATLTATTEYHKAHYTAVADWNLITAFAHPRSFDHHADGSGWTHELQLTYNYKPNISINAFYTQQQRKTSAGQDTLYLSDGSTLMTQLNPVTWESYAVGLGMTFIY